MSELAVEVGDRFECVRGEGLCGKGEVLEVKGFDDSAHDMALFRGGTGMLTRCLLDEQRFRRLPRAKPTVPRVAKSFEELREGMRVRFAWSKTMRDSGFVNGEGVLRRNQEYGCLACPLVGGMSGDVLLGHPASFGNFERIEILSEPDEAKPAAACAHKRQELRNHVARYICTVCGMLSNDGVTWAARAEPGRVFEAPAPKSEPQGCHPKCTVGAPCRRNGVLCRNAQKADELRASLNMSRAITQESAAMLERALNKSEREKRDRDAHEKAPVLRPWVMLNERVGGWNRRGTL